jgi:hypothetical protein
MQIGSQKDKISIEDLEQKINDCEHCQSAYTPGLSIQAIYYAPPGAGKTSCLNDELLVEFDTDWIGVGYNWKAYAKILRIGIPIITNQPEAFVGCGLKITGIVKEKIRLRPDGIPFDTQARILSWARTQSRNVSLIQVTDEQYLSHFATHLQMIALIQRLIANRSINILPFYKNETTEE